MTSTPTWNPIAVGSARIEPGKVAGVYKDLNLVEIVELPDHPWFVGVQFHPELRSRPADPHPLFKGFVRAALEERHRREAAATGSKSATGAPIK